MFLIVLKIDLFRFQVGYRIHRHGESSEGTAADSGGHAEAVRCGRGPRGLSHTDQRLSIQEWQLWT